MGKKVSESVHALPEDCEKIISQWAADDYYVYIRPITSTYASPTKPHVVYWNVLVEYRNPKYKRWLADGESLADCIRNLGSEIPRRKKLDPGYVAAGKKGRGTSLGPYAPAGPLKTNESIEAVADKQRAEKKAKKPLTKKAKKKAKKGKVKK